ncbi:ImmA/IrrE family metallo-endopeptidase [Corynebacterium diphtheriae]
MNSNEPEVRQRFTLAHEIGHLVEREHLGKDVEYSFIDYRNNGKCDLHEFYADEFAGSLLMPAREFSKILDKKANVLPQSTSESHNQQ